jgi:adenylylsulfate kinase
MRENGSGVAQKEISRSIGAPNSGLVIWFTGLGSAGKTTLSTAVYHRISNMGYRVEHLDGDAVRQDLSKGLGFTREDRNENVRRIGFVANLLRRHGVIVIVSAISPYREARDEVRERIGAGFIEVYVDAALSVCEARDTKGLYKRARAGLLRNMTGVDAPYEAPASPEIVCHTDVETVEQSAAKVMAFLERFSG